MKILHLLSSGNTGGIERLCLNIAVESDWDNAFCFFYGDGKIYDEMKEKGFNVIDLANKSFLSKVMYIVKLSKNFDILVSHNEDFFIRAVQCLVCLFSSIKNVCFIHSCFYKESFYPKSFLKRSICKLIFQLNFFIVDKIIAVANAGFDSYSKCFYFNKKKCEVLYNGIGKNFIKKGLCHKLKSNPNKFNILYIGRLSYYKRVDLLIDAISMLSKTYDIHLNIVGDGKELINLKKQVSLKQLDDIISFEGEKTNLDEYFINADIFVYPSEQEIFGLSIVEAMAYGLPCIANKVGGIPEFVKENNGFITKSITAEGILEQIIVVINLYQNYLITEISNNAKLTANRLSMKNNLINMKSIFKSVINNY